MPRLPDPTAVLLMIAALLVACDDGSGGRDVCEYGRAFTDQFDDHCDRSEDCVVARSGADCCGAGLATGIAAGDASDFTDAWSECAPTLQQCDCPAGPTIVDNGATTWNDEHVQVECVDGRCRTSVLCGEEVCEDGTTCQPCWGADACVPQGSDC